jgi:hypothetical protein
MPAIAGSVRAEFPNAITKLNAAFNQTSMVHLQKSWGFVIAAACLFLISFILVSGFADYVQKFWVILLDLLLLCSYK